MIQNQVRHADEHVFFNVRIKLAVYFPQDIRRRRVPDRFRAQDAAANRHNQRCRHAFAGNVCDCDAKALFIDMDVIEIIAAYLASWHIQTADFEPIDGRGLRWKQDTLNVTRDFEVVIQPFLFVRHRINDRVVERKGGLLGNGFENDKISLRKRHTLWTIGQRQNTEILLAISERRGHHRYAAKGASSQFGQLRRFREFVETNRLTCLPDATNQSFVRTNRMEPQEALKGDGIGSGLLQNILRKIYQRRTAFRDECGRELATCPIGHVERAAVGVKNAHGPFHNESMQFLGSNGSPERFAQPVEEIEDERLLDLNFLMRTLQSANSPSLEICGDTPAGQRRDEQSKEKSRPHCARPAYFEDVS